MIVGLLLDAGDIKIVNINKSQIIDPKSKTQPTLLIEAMPEIRYYPLPDNRLVSSFTLLSCSADILNVWYPIAGKCVRNLKIGSKPNEVLKQIGSFEITNSEKAACNY